MKTRRYLVVCLVAGGLAFGVGSAASRLQSRTTSATGGILRTLLRRLRVQSV